MVIHQLKREDADFQQPVNERELRSQLIQHLPDEKIIAVSELKAGWFNNTYRVNTLESAYILKVAPEPEAPVFYCERHLMQREHSVSQQLQSASPLVPEYLTFFNVDGRDAFLQPFVEGRLWHEVMSSLAAAENAQLWKQLGEFASKLHNCGGEQFGYPAPFKGFDRWSEFIADNVEGMVNDCRRLDIFHREIETYLNHLPYFFPALDKIKTANLLHGDLWPRNVIIDGDGADVHIKAVIDGERAFWGDPASDWVLILYGVPRAFWQGYGENLVDTRDPVCIAIYKGMYFILNILEAVRSKESDAVPRKNLSAINKELKQWQLK